MQGDTLSIPVTTATITLVLLLLGTILGNIVAVIWTWAVMSTKQGGLTDRADGHGDSIRALEVRVGEQGERIAALESRERGRGEGP